MPCGAKERKMTKITITSETGMEWRWMPSKQTLKMIRQEASDEAYAIGQSDKADAIYEETLVSEAVRHHFGRRSYLSRDRRFDGFCGIIRTGIARYWRNNELTGFVRIEIANC